MPVSISRWKAPPPAPRAIQAAMVRSSPSAGVSRCARYASNRPARAGVNTSTGGVKPRDRDAVVTALRSQQRAADVGFDWPDASGPILKVNEELVELERETGAGRREGIADEIGDLLFAVVNLARKLDIDPRAALERANDKFQRRFKAVERLAAERGLQMGQASLEDLDRLWDEVKGQSL